MQQQSGTLSGGTVAGTRHGGTLQGSANTGVLGLAERAYLLYRQAATALTDIPLLLVRLTLAYGFYGPAMEKVRHFSSIPEWFGSLGIPFPTLNAYMAVSTEVTGIVLLTLGLATRLISIPMIFVMLVAIATVHWKHGFEAAHNGFEIPYYYILMLLVLIVAGPGRISVDYLVSRAYARRRREIA